MSLPWSLAYDAPLPTPPVPSPVKNLAALCLNQASLWETLVGFLESREVGLDVQGTKTHLDPALTLPLPLSGCSHVHSISSEASVLRQEQVSSFPPLLEMPLVQPGGSSVPLAPRAPISSSLAVGDGQPSQMRDEQVFSKIHGWVDFTHSLKLINTILKGDSLVFIFIYLFTYLFLYFAHQASGVPLSYIASNSLVF